MIHSKNLTYQYPEENLLKFPDISVPEKDALLISGESGCGKTTLLHLLAGLRQPKSGTICIHKEITSELNSYKMDQFRGKHIGIVFQQPYFISSLTVLENLTLSPFVKDKQKVIELAEQMQIKGSIFKKPHQLSLGQQQRATIARAVINSPKLILADEPTSSLDNKNCSKVIQLLLEETMRNNASLIVVSHDDRIKKEIKNFIELEPLN